jgi:hypothetical protein
MDSYEKIIRQNNRYCWFLFKYIFKDNPMSPITQKTINNILSNLANVREDLFTLSDVIWESINHNDPKGLEEGVAFKKQFNALFEKFIGDSDDLEKLISDFTGFGEEDEDDSEEVECSRIIKELDKEMPHSLDEDFTFKRPFAFCLENFASNTVNTWNALARQFCKVLLEKDFSKMFEIADGDALLSKQGNKPLAISKEGMRRPVLVAEKDGKQVWLETNRSAQELVKLIKALLVLYKIDSSSMKIYLREDRNA